MCSPKLRPFPSQIARAAASIAVVVWQVNILVAGIYYPSFFYSFFLTVWWPFNAGFNCTYQHFRLVVMFKLKPKTFSA